MAVLFRTQALSEHITAITDIAGTHFFLVTGNREAALIDTGAGVGSLKQFVRTITGLPIKVIITHGHMDHAFGAAEFEQVFMSKLDKMVYQYHGQTSMRLDYIHGSLQTGGLPEAVQVQQKDILSPLPFEKLRDLHPGDCFDLGGISLEIHEGEGHTPGCVTILIPEERILLLGDACNQFTYLFESTSLSVAQYREMLLRLDRATAGRYDRVLICHGPTCKAAPDMIRRVIEVCDDVLKGKDDAVPFRGTSGEAACIAKAMDFTTFSRIDGGIGNLVYDPQKIG